MNKTPIETPLTGAALLYDGDCGFCTKSIRVWQKMTRDRIACAPYQTALPQFPQVTAAQCNSAVQLILSTGKVYSGAHAVFKSLALADKYRALLWLYEKFLPFRWISERFYRFVARNRRLSSRF